MSTVLSAVIEPGFFANAPVRTALLAGGVVAAVSGVVGMFTVLRGQSFAGHALADVGATGGSGAFLIGVNPLWGFIGIGVVAAGIMELIGIRRPRGRDVATGIVLGAGLGLAALFLYWGTTYTNTTGRHHLRPLRLHVRHLHLDGPGHPGGQRRRPRGGAAAVPAVAAQLGQR